MDLSSLPFLFQWKLCQRKEKMENRIAFLHKRTRSWKQSSWEPLLECRAKLHFFTSWLLCAENGENFMEILNASWQFMLQWKCIFSVIKALLYESYYILLLFKILSLPQIFLTAEMNPESRKKKTQSIWHLLNFRQISLIWNLSCWSLVSL